MPVELAPNVVMSRGGVPKVAPDGYRSPYDQDWRVLFGLSLTFVYLILMSLYIDTEVGWLEFVALEVEKWVASWRAPLPRWRFSGW